ncbi:MAG: hypothetical protein NTX15_08355 [Candidatus Kapabacteria bacterium]|nr:hypothetical protein [Candidatus Kapabacteria bacterium]
MAFDPKAIGKQLVSVGDKQVSTGKNLESVAKELQSVAGALGERGLATSLTSVETGTRSTRELMLPIVSLLRSVATGLDGVRTPTVDFSRSSFDIPVIGKVQLVTGITVGSTRPLRDIAKNIKDTAENINNVAKALKVIADGVRDTQKQLPVVKANLLNSAAAISQGGKDLQTSGALIKQTGTLFQV